VNVSEPTIYRRIAEGSLPAVRVGGSVGPLRVVESELEAWLFRSESSRGNGDGVREAGSPFPGVVAPSPPTSGTERAR
jgi:excisionase family DNA binding protein